MSSIKDLLQKVATTEKKKEAGMTQRALDERELIRKARSEDKYEARFAQKQLLKSYRNVIGQQAKITGLSAVTDPNIAHTFGTKILKELIHKYDLAKGVQPNTYFQNQLGFLMGKEKLNHVDFAAKKTADLAQKNAHVKRAEGILRMTLGREPTYQEIYDYITKKENLKIELKNIERIKAYDRSDYSGNIRIGDDTNADYMTLMDVVNVDTFTPEQSYIKDLEKKGHLEAIKSFTSKKERRFLYNILGYGEFEGKGEKSVSAAATNNNLSLYDAKKVRDRFLKMIGHEV